MTRLAGVLVALLCLIPAANASLDRPKLMERPVNMRVVLPKTLPPGAAEVPPPAQAQITDETEVLLDGERRPYKDVPATASVTRLVLASDGKTILRIEFQSRK